MSKNLRSLWMIGLGFGILFTLVAAGQYAFLRYQIDKETTQDLLSGADEMREDIVSAEPWNLEGYRNSTSGPDTYIVIAANGTLIDTHGFQSRMLPGASVPFPEKFDQILKYTSDVKENWNLYIHKLTDGFLILGVLDEDAPAHLDERFAETSAKFGSRVATALATSERKVPQSFDYAIIDQSGGLKYVAGGIPFKNDSAPNSSCSLRQVVRWQGRIVHLGERDQSGRESAGRTARPDSRFPRRYGSASDASSSRHLQSSCWWNFVAGDDAGGGRLLAASCS